MASAALTVGEAAAFWVVVGTFLTLAALVLQHEKDEAGSFWFELMGVSLIGLGTALGFWELFISQKDRAGVLTVVVLALVALSTFGVWRRRIRRRGISKRKKENAEEAHRGGEGCVEDDVEEEMPARHKLNLGRCWTAALGLLLVAVVLTRR